MGELVGMAQKQLQSELGVGGVILGARREGIPIPGKRRG